MSETWKSIGKILLGTLMILAVLAVVSGALALLKVGGFLTLYWRLCSGIGAIVLLAGAVMLLTHRSPEKTKMKAWDSRFPGLTFLAAVLLVGFLLILAACLINYLSF